MQGQYLCKSDMYVYFFVYLCHSPIRLNFFLKNVKTIFLAHFAHGFTKLRLSINLKICMNLLFFSIVIATNIAFNSFFLSDQITGYKFRLCYNWHAIFYLMNILNIKENLYNFLCFNTMHFLRRLKPFHLTYISRVAL